MTQDTSLVESLAENLQSALDNRLTVGEAVLIALAGAAGEALAATDRRVVLLREQLPIIGTEAQVDCFEYPYEQIATIRIDDAIGGGHVKLALVTPPVDDKEATLFFPPYAFTKFDTAAGRIRMLAEQTRSVPVSAALPASLATLQAALCGKCARPVEEGHWSYCAACGALQGDVCGCCETVLPSGAGFCPRCGTPADSVRGSGCVGCGRHISVVFAFCPECGVSQGKRCSRCAGRILSGWKGCPACGEPVDSGAIGTRTSELKSDRNTVDSVPESADEHNAVGRRLYEAENYGEAIAHFQTAIELDPRNTLFRCNLGVVFAELGQDDAALGEYRAAIEMSPSDPTAYLNLGYFYSERENAAEARKALEKVMEVAPDTPEAEEAAQIIEGLDEL